VLNRRKSGSTTRLYFTRARRQSLLWWCGHSNAEACPHTQINPSDHAAAHPVRSCVGIRGGPGMVRAVESSFMDLHHFTIQSNNRLGGTQATPEEVFMLIAITALPRIRGAKQTTLGRLWPFLGSPYCCAGPYAEQYSLVRQSSLRIF